MGVMGVRQPHQANAVASASASQKQVGQTGVPVYNVANACATGATAFRTAYLAHQGRRVRHGPRRRRRADGQAGPAGRGQPGRKDEKVFEPDGRYGGVMGPEGVLGTGLMPGVFAQAGMEYAYENDGVGFEQFAKVALEEPRPTRCCNPLAQYQKEFSLDEVMGAEMISYPNTLLMCCPTGDGAAAAVLVTGEKLQARCPRSSSAGP